MLQEVKQLSDEVKVLKTRLARTEDRDEKIKLKREYHQKELELIDLIDEDTRDKQRWKEAGAFMEYVDGLPNIPKYETGVAEIDSNLGGFEAGTFTLLVAESGAGKSRLAQRLVQNVAVAKPSVFFNFEMGQRIFANRLKKENLNEDQKKNLRIDTVSREINELEKEIKKHYADGVRFFAIDSRMKIELPDSLKDYQKNSEITARLTKLAQQLDVIIILIDQMSEDDIKNKRLAVKGSGDKKYDADVILFLIIGENKERKLVCTKNRTGDERLWSVDITERTDSETVVEFHGGVA